MKSTIVFFPDYSGGNPYQKLLYKPCADVGMRLVPGGVDIALEQDEPSEVIFHVHWLNALFSHAVTQTEAWTAANNFINATREFVGKGGTLFWTVHNHAPHEGLFLEQDLRVQLFLATFANRIHLHCPSHISELSHLPLDPERVAIHRHGSYLGYYGPFSINTRTQTFDSTGFRALFLGSLRPYKGIETLVRTVRQFRKVGIPVTVAGSPADDEVRRQLAPLNDDPGIALILRRLAEPEIHSLCSEHNIGILAYDRILTSGTLKLYLSYGMLIVAPAVPTIVAEDRLRSFVYVEKSQDGATKAIEAIKTFSAERAKNAFHQSYFLAQEARWSASLFDI